MARSGRWVRCPARFCIASLTAAAALLVTAVPSTADPEDLSVYAAADVTTLSSGWSNPWGMSFLPDGRSALVTENETSRVFRLRDDGSRTLVGRVPHMVVYLPGDSAKGGLLGVAVSPTWDGKKDKAVFFMHTTKTETRVVRMNYDGGTSMSGYTVVLDGIRRGSNHNGGKIAFGPDGYLYVATGEATQAELAQDTNSINGKILRITKTGAPAPGNPFGNHIYSYGHRNPQGLAWDGAGRLWSVEIGQEATDELNLIEPGRNYGWPSCEGRCTAKGMTNPKVTWAHTTAPAQVAVAGDNLYVSSLRGYQLWRVGIDAAIGGTGDQAKTNVFGGHALRALTKVPGRNELWLGTARSADGNDMVLRVTVQ